MRAELFLFAGLIGLAPACTMHSALPTEQRMVQLSTEAPAISEAWRSAEPGDLAGSYVSVEIQGAAAEAVRQMTYHFAADGSYSGSALIAAGGPPQHQAITGQWTLENGHLRLGRGAPAARARVCGRRLELATDLGTVVLTRTP